MPALTEGDRAVLDGQGGEAAALAMRLVVRLAEVVGATHLIHVTRAHVDGCLYHGRAGLDFAERLVAGAGRVAIPTTLNVGSLDLLHPDLYRGDPERARAARRLMECYEELGCRPTWTCAPYQLPERPGFGEQVAWAESNAIVFANSVLGARTNRYGDFIDICAGLTGRVPAAGLHLDEHRVGEVLYRLDGVPERLLDEDSLYPVLGHLVGSDAGRRVPVIDGLPTETASEDRLKALGAAAASSGSVALFHAVGITPEAPDATTALGGRPPLRSVTVTPAMLRTARGSLTTDDEGVLAAVSVGTPHLSLPQLRALGGLVEGARPRVPFYASTSRHALEEARAGGWPERLEEAGVRLVVDTCTYVTPILSVDGGLVMTDSAKWAYYAPGNLGVEVAFGSLEECVRSAAAGRVVRDEKLWAGA